MRLSVLVIMILVVSIGCGSSPCSAQQPRNLAGMSFDDGFVFLSGSVIGTGFTYVFHDRSYRLIARTNSGAGIQTIEVERGSYALSNDTVIITPIQRMGTSLGVFSEGRELLVPYEVAGFTEGFMVDRDTLSEQALLDLRFVTRRLILSKADNRYVLHDRHIRYLQLEH